MEDLEVSLLAAARTYAARLRDIRRDLHRHPELGFEERRTTAAIVAHLGRIPGMKIWHLDSPTGVVADLPGDSPRVVALRADIDALPIQEGNTHGYVSEEPGRMHACGHDGHVALLLGAAFLLGDLPDRPWTVRFIFQPAEEIVPSGAPVILREGALKDVEGIFGCHLNATSDFGEVGWYDGAVMAGGVGFRIVVHGKGGHSAYPERCVNPLFTAAEILLSLGRIRDAFHPMHPCNIVPVQCAAGDYDNRIPDTAAIEGRFKYLAREIVAPFKQEMTDLVQGCARKNHTRCELEFSDKYPITWNNPGLGRHVVIPSAGRMGLPLVRIAPSMGSDDFAYYADAVPAYYMTFGIRTGDDFPIAHTPHFDFNEDVLPIAAAQMAACALNFKPEYARPSADVG